VGWRFDPAAWGQGLASEGARAALHEGFSTLGLDEICSLPQSTNPRSYAVCERIGMTFEREVECPATDRRGAVTARMYTSGRADWSTTRS
jgi:RimJ/RimL family protein N-acetyltransferase